MRVLLCLLAGLALAACDSPSEPVSLSADSSAASFARGRGRWSRPDPTPAPAPAPDPTPAPEDPALCSPSGAGRLVRVSTASELSSALSGAQEGDAINLADGTYGGPFKLTDKSAVRLCGTRAAILRGGGTSGGYPLTITTGDRIEVRGLTLTSGLMGLYATRLTNSLLDDLHVHTTGQEGIHIRTFSSDNVIQNSHISNTGLTVAEYGEGVYIGTDIGQWGSYTGGQPDRSDRNRVLNNHFGPDIRSEAIDVKEGTSGGLIQGNTFDGRGLVRSKSWVNSLVELKGNGYTVSGNSGRMEEPGEHCFDNFSKGSGLGIGNVFGPNSCTAPRGQYSVIAGNTVR